MTLPSNPSAPPAIPSDIPAETMKAAREALLSLFDRIGFDAAVAVEPIARALLAAQERGKLMERERCAGICDLEAANARFQSFPHEALGAVWCARAIRNPAPQHVIAMEGDV